MNEPMIIGWDLASGPDISVSVPVYIPPPKVVSLLKYRRAKAWRELKRHLEAGLYIPFHPHQ